MTGLHTAVDYLSKMELVRICMVLALVNVGFSWSGGSEKRLPKVQIGDFDYDFGANSTQVKVYEKAALASTRKRTHISVQKVVDQFKALHEKAKTLPPNTGAVATSLLKLTSDIANVAKLGNTSVGTGLAKLLQVATALDKNWGSLTGEDAAAIGKGVCDVVSVATAFIPPPCGILVSSVVGLIGNLIGTQAGQPKGMGAVVKEVMETVLDKQYMFVMEGRIEGSLTILDETQALLNDYAASARNISQKEYDYLLSQFDALKTLELQEELMKLIGQKARSKKKEDSADAVKFTRSYILLVSMREVLLHTMRAILQREEIELPANSLGRSIDRSKVRTHDRLEFLRIPKQENGVFFAQYKPEENPDIEKYLDGLQLSIKPLSFKGCYQLANKKGKLVKLKRRFSFGKTDASNFEFFNQGKYWIVRSQDGLVCSSPKNKFLEVNKPDCSMDSERAQFRIYAFADGGYLILNNQWPTSPLWLHKKGLFNDPFSKSLNVDGDETKWNEQDPEYVWELKPSTC